MKPNNHQNKPSLKTFSKHLARLKELDDCREKTMCINLLANIFSRVLTNPFEQNVSLDDIQSKFQEISSDIDIVYAAGFVCSKNGLKIMCPLSNIKLLKKANKLLQQTVTKRTEPTSRKKHRNITTESTKQHKQNNKVTDETNQFQQHHKHNDATYPKTDICNMSININQMCFCQKALKKYAYAWTNPCVSCCQQYKPHQMQFYVCDRVENCKYYQVSTVDYIICAQCYHTNENDPKPTDDDFIVKKTNANIEIISRQLEQLLDIDKRKRYMYRIYIYLYSAWINKLSNNKLIQEFNTFYDKHLKNIAAAIDLSELEFDEKLFMTDNNTKLKLKNKQLIEINRIRLEWYELKKEQQFTQEQESKEQKVNEINEFDDDIKCKNIIQCFVRRRVKFILSEFKKRFLTKYVYETLDGDNNEVLQYIEIFQNALVGYDVIDLINDYYHCKSHHLNDNGLKDCHIKSNDNDMCVDYLMRKQRQNELAQNDIFNIYIKTLDYKQINIIEITTNLHSVINHWSDYQKKQEPHKQFKIRSLKWRKNQQITNPSDHKIKHNKFINEIIENAESKNKKKGLIEDLQYVLNKNGLPHANCQQLMKYLYQNEFDSDAIIGDLRDVELDPFNNYKCSYIFTTYLNENKHYAKIIKHHLNATYNDDDKVTEFALGPGNEIFVYQSWFKKHSEQSGFEHFIEKRKYATLKKECLHNNIYPMNITRFHQLLNKAYTLKNSNKGKRKIAKDFSADNLLYEVPAKLPITISHILVLLMYCNENELQRQYKAKGCRQLIYNEDLNAIKQRNQEIGHWYTLLFEAITFYGYMATEKDIFYTGLDVKVVFSTFTPRFTCPLSTTTQWSVACGFSEQRGVIMELSALPGCRDMYADCEWVSAFPHERERLFFKTVALQICDIQTFHFHKRICHEEYIAAFTLLSNIFDGNYFTCKLANKNKIQKILLKLVVNYCENNGIQTKQKSNSDSNIPIYIQQLFYHLVNSFKARSGVWNYINRSEYELLTGSLREHILSFDSDTMVYNHVTVFEKYILAIINQSPNPWCIFRGLREIIKSIVKNQKFTLSASNPFYLRLIGTKGSFQFLMQLGFKIRGCNNRMQPLLVCINTPTSKVIESALNSFNVFNPNKIKLSSFVASFVQIQDIRCYEEFIWILDRNQLNQLQFGQKDLYICSQPFVYKLSKQVDVKIKFAMQNTSSDGYFSFGIILERLPSLPELPESLRLRYCVLVDELDWFRNELVCNLSQGEQEIIYLFRETLFKSKNLNSMKLRIAIFCD